jgi:hypothetical protein
MMIATRNIIPPDVWRAAHHASAQDSEQQSQLETQGVLNTSEQLRPDLAESNGTCKPRLPACQQEFILGASY